MGNKLVLGRRRMQVVDDKYTRPQGLYEHKDVDQKKLRKLILDSKLAPCYPGDEECTYDLEECPICFLHYPSLNRSRCCAKGICTECFLQMKLPHSTCPTQCPFCKTSNYAVEYRGARSKEEKGMEQIEEQRVIEAKIRMQQQELLDGEERMQSRQESSSSRQIMTTGDVGYRDIASSSLAVPSFSLPEEGDESINYQDPCVMAAQPSHLRLNGGDQSDLDLEDIMVMEAIWLSIQENGTERNLDDNFTDPSETFVEDRHVSPTTVPVAEVSSPSSSLACATVASPRLDGDCSSDAENASTVSLHSETGRLPTRDGGGESYDPEPWVAISPGSGREWETDHGSEMAGVAFSYASSDATVNGQWPHDSSRHQFQPNITMPIVPDNFEEQMMLATAVSLAETRARTSSPGVAWN